MKLGDEKTPTDFSVGAFAVGVGRGLDGFGFDDMAAGLAGFRFDFDGFDGLLFGLNADDRIDAMSDNES